MPIRPFQPADATTLAPIYNQLYPEKVTTPAAFQRHLNRLGHAWVIEQSGQVQGYAAVQPVPGLEGVVELQGCIAPAVQRQGLGSHLLRRLLNELQGSSVAQLSYPVSSLDSPAALFLGHHGFTVEHEEWQMRLGNLATLPAVQLPAGWSVKTLTHTTAIPLFRRLYRQSFSPHPWFQAYTANREVVEELRAIGGTAADILFLAYDGEPAGFAWTRLPAPTIGEIEPIGLIPTFQRQGLGRQLLLAALHKLAQRGASQVQLGVWTTNTAAIHLYQQLGFRPTQTTTYLALNIGGIKQ
jgi:mycothiol synthase